MCIRDRRSSRAERPAVRRSLQQHRVPRDLVCGRSRGAAQADRRERRLWPHGQDQQVAGLLPGVARGAGARCRTSAGQGRDADAAAQRHLRLADAADLGSRGRPAPFVVAPRRVPRPGPWRGRPGSVRGTPARCLHRGSRAQARVALSRRHAAEFHSGVRASAQSSLAETRRFALGQRTIALTMARD